MMKTRIKMLKVKIKSLACEARIIRREERLAGGGSQLQCEMHRHRTIDVRPEQRASLLAYAFLRGRSRTACEPKYAAEPDWGRVLKLVEKFGPVLPAETKDQTRQRLAEWRTAAAPSA
jgi:hypothetical protein